MLSAKGRCFTFDAHADGYLRGEGAGSAVLKKMTADTLAWAEARHDIGCSSQSRWSKLDAHRSKWPLTVIGPALRQPSLKTQV
eukprot:3269435-Amphidinium_carterae.1